jgi:SAM-dependent methyltransferase
MSFAFVGIPRRIGKDFSPAAPGRDSRWRMDMAAKQRENALRLRGCQIRLSRCPICGSEQFEPFTSVFDYSWAQCSRCEHLFCETPPDDDAVAALYSTEDDRRCAQGAIHVDDELFRVRVERIARPKAEFVASEVGERGTRVDIGCATGELLAAAQSLGWKCRGVESDADEIAFGRRHGLDIAAGFVDRSNIGGFIAGARVVSLVNVLEHIREPVELLAAASAAVAAGRYVVLEVPRHPSLARWPTMPSRSSPAATFTRRTVCTCSRRIRRNECWPARAWGRSRSGPSARTLGTWWTR